MKEIRESEREVNGITEQSHDGQVYWMGTKVMPCPDCGITVTNVDHCGKFGDPDCPVWGIGREKYERRYGE